ncbi:hypothetical protein SAMN05216414_102110 [Nitrosovibrio sp. Nv17]|nr:hypothetical protein SAMN05216414_102110 [Nitrosovibrio sp. Nv17]
MDMDPAGSRMTACSSGVGRTGSMACRMAGYRETRHSICPKTYGLNIGMVIMRAKIERILGVLGLLCVLGLLGFCAQRSPWEVYDADTRRAVGTAPADGAFSARQV